MHELSICEVLITTILTEMDRIKPPPRRLLKVRVVLGELRQVVPECLQFAYEELSKGTPAEGSTLEIVHRPVTARCRQCGWEGEIKDKLFLCGRCEAANVEVLTGKELYLDSLEIDQDDE